MVRRKGRTEAPGCVTLRDSFSSVVIRDRKVRCSLLLSGLWSNKNNCWPTRAMFLSLFLFALHISNCSGLHTSNFFFSYCLIGSDKNPVLNNSFLKYYILDEFDLF